LNAGPAYIRLAFIECNYQDRRQQVVFLNKINLNPGQRILLVGDLSNLLTETGDIAWCLFDRCDDLLDAIDKVQTGDFDFIAAAIPEHFTGFTLSLKSLRKATKARIVLLAQMYQEPAAKQIVESSGAEPAPADDYIICPAELSSAACLQNSQFEMSVLNKRIACLEQLATEDDLTGLKNRRYIYEFTRQIIELAGKNNNRVTLLMFDIDNFKRYNDLFGHYAGDEILKQAAVLMKRCCRSHDVVGRIGGDEFAVVFWDETRIHESNLSQNPAEHIVDANQERRLAKAEHPTEAIYMAQRLAASLKETQLSSFNELGTHGKGVLTISGGLASFPRDGSTVQELFQQADKALLDAKRSGKNRIYLVGSPAENSSEVTYEQNVD
jgi:diguanylate cyclase (GGDEF)-like protein